MNAPGTMRIGEVHALLRQDYPDIELSKIRYYEDKGLVRPARSRKGYRLYSDRDVACLREAIRLANEEFVPLKVVRVRLIEQGLLDDDAPGRSSRTAARDAGVAPVRASAPVRSMIVPLRPVATDPVAPKTTSPGDGRAPGAWSFATFAVAGGVDADLLQTLASQGMVGRLDAAGERVFDEHDLEVARAAQALLARGADARYLGSIRRLVEREVAIVEEMTAGLRGPLATVDGATAYQVTGEVFDEVAVLRELLTRRAREEFLGS